MGVFSTLRPEKSVVLRGVDATVSRFANGNRGLVIENIGMAFSFCSGDEPIIEAELRFFIVEEREGGLRIVREGELRDPGIYSLLFGELSPDLRYAVIEGPVHGYSARGIFMCELATRRCRLMVPGLNDVCASFL